MGGMASEASAHRAAGGRRADVAAGLLLALLVLAVFGQAVRFGWVFDDDVYVTDVPQVQAGLTLEGVRWAFTTNHAEFWHPLVWLSLMLDRELLGPGPAGFHLTAILLHLACSLLLYLLLRGLTGSRGAALLATLLFAVHPLRAESVAWVSDRKDLLAALLCLLTLLAYRAYAARPAAGRYLAVCAAFALGLMAKPSLVVLPAALLVLDWWPLGRHGTTPGSWRAGAGRLLLEKVPLLVLAAGAAAAAYWAQASRGGVADILPLRFRVANALISTLRYLRDLVWPSGLAPFYPHPGVTTSLAGGLAAGAAVVAATLLLLRLRNRTPHLLAGWLWYLLMLLPVIGFVQVGNHSHADRYTYLPHIGILAALAVEAVRRARSSVAWRRALPPTAAAAVAVLALLAARQTSFWSSGVRLYRHALAVTSRNWFAHLNLGIEYLHAGEPAAAEEQFRAVLAINPRSPAAAENMALALAGLGRPAEALPYAREAAHLKPGVPRVRHNLGYLLAANGDLEGAVREWRTALELDPSQTQTRVNLGIALAELGRRGEAIEVLEEAVRRSPGDAEAREALGRLRAAPP